METPAPATRKNSPPVKVYCLPEERRQIEAQAHAAGMSLSTYLLRVGLGYRIPGVLDHQRVEELARINGDLGQLGGLLNLWMSDDARAAEVGVPMLRAALVRIKETQQQMQEIMREVVMSKATARGTP